jgi:hypothetical protein
VVDGSGVGVAGSTDGGAAVTVGAEVGAAGVEMTATPGRAQPRPAIDRASMTSADGLFNIRLCMCAPERPPLEGGGSLELDKMEMVNGSLNWSDLTIPKHGNSGCGQMEAVSPRAGEPSDWIRQIELAGAVFLRSEER